jgi:hypothetical protein
MNISYAQTNTTTPVVNIKQMADEQKLVFKAEAINVHGGQGAPSALFYNTHANGPDNHITLNGDYTVMLTPEKLTSYLPLLDDQFYKRPPGDKYINPTLSPAGFKFSSAKYKYTVKQQKQGGVEISISPEDNTGLRNFLLRVQANGKATLTVTSGGNTVSYAGVVGMEG